MTGTLKNIVEAYSHELYSEAAVENLKNRVTEYIASTHGIAIDDVEIVVAFNYVTRTLAVSSNNGQVRTILEKELSQ